MNKRNTTRQNTKSKLLLKRDIIRVLTSTELRPVRAGCEQDEYERDWPRCINPIYSA